MIENLVLKCILLIVFLLVSAILYQIWSGFMDKIEPKWDNLLDHAYRLGRGNGDAETKPD